MLPVVSLRINIDKENLTAGEGVYNFLRDNSMLENVHPYYGMITNDTGTHNDAKCLNNCDFTEISYDYNYAKNTNNEHPVQYPIKKSSFCGADSLWSYVVDAEGWLYKCYCEIGDENNGLEI